MFVLGENHFRKCFSGNAGVWLVRKIEFSGNWFPLTEKKRLWLWKWIFVPIFTSNEFQRERERERERGRSMHALAPFARTELQSAPFASTSAIDRDLAPSIAISPSRRSREIVIDASRDHAVDRDLAFAPIAILRSGAVLREITIDGVVVGLELAKHRAVEPSRASSVNLGLSFPSSFPNTKKYFSENFWKCNQTHENIFLSGKWNIFRKCFYTNQT